MFYMLTVELEFIFFIFYFVRLGGFQYRTIPLTVSLFYPFFCSKYYYFYTSIREEAMAPNALKRLRPSSIGDHLKNYTHRFGIAAGNISVNVSSKC